jgi:hypothetical protein
MESLIYFSKLSVNEDLPEIMAALFRGCSVLIMSFKDVNVAHNCLLKK